MYIIDFKNHKIFPSYGTFLNQQLLFWMYKHIFFLQIEILFCALSDYQASRIFTFMKN
jgi:hypothetical protein